LPALSLIRSRAPRSFATSRAFSYCAKPHHDPRRVGGVRQVIAVDREHAHAALDEQQQAKLLRDEIAGEAAGILNDDRADAIALDTIQQCREARTDLNGSAPLTAGSQNQAAISMPCRLVNASTATRCRFSLSLSAPTLAADEVRT
jgi:hypothetical protein